MTTNSKISGTNQTLKFKIDVTSSTFHPLGMRSVEFKENKNIKDPFRNSSAKKGIFFIKELISL